MEPPGVKRKSPRPNPLDKLNRDQRQQFAIDILNAVRRISDARFIACEIDKAKAYSRVDITRPDQIYNQGILLAMERIQYLLAAKKSRGVIIQDSREYQQDMRLRSFYGSLISKGSYWTSFPNIVEGVFLSPSDYTIGLQVADFCVGAVAKTSKLARHREPKFFNEITNKITNRGRDGVVRGGLKHWP